MIEDETDFVLPWINSLKKYDAGKPISIVAKSLGIDETKIIKLASNENAFGCSPKIKEFISLNAIDVNRYPDGDSFILKNEIKKKFNVSSDQIIVGNGSNDILDIIARVFLSPGRSSMFSQYSFAVYPLASKSCGAEIIEVPVNDDFSINLERMVSSIKKNTSIVFIANPNNPTGSYVNLSSIESFLDSINKEVIVVLDQAYFEYVENDEKNSIELIKKYPNLFITRSFSKAYGLAGLRVGFGIGSPKIINLLNRLRQPFNVNLFAQELAVLALKDNDFIKHTVSRNKIIRDEMTKEISSKGILCLPSMANFVLARVSDLNKLNTNIVSAGVSFFNLLLEYGVITRPVDNYNLQDWIRISVGTEKENFKFLDIFTQVIKKL